MARKKKQDLDLPDAPSLPFPEIQFDEWCLKFDKIRDVLETDEWKNVYSLYMDFDEYELDIDINETMEEIEAYSLERQAEEIQKCFNSFDYFCHKYVKIAHPIRGLIPFRSFKYQQRVIAAYESHRFNILSKFRQGGLTTVSVLWALWLCMFQTDQRILVVSKTDREAISAGEIAKRAMDYMPDWIKPKMSKANEHERQFDDTGSILWCYTVEAARSKSISLIIIDEAAFIPDMHKHWKGMYPTIATGGRCCVISTVNGMGNWYEEWYHKAKAGKNPFHVVEMDYWEHPEYNDPKWAADTKANLGEKGWRQEVLRSFMGSDDTFIDSEILEELTRSTKATRPARMLFEQYANTSEEGEDLWKTEGALWIWREPADGREYILAADCAEGIGDKGDNSAFQILDSATLEQVAEFYSNNVQPNVFAQIIHRIGIYYNTALVVIENMSMGGSVLITLQHDLGYENLYYDPTGKQRSPGLKPGKANRPVMLETLQNRLLGRSVKINSVRLADELGTFIFNHFSKKPEAKRNKHDDAIMALALGLYVRDSQLRSAPIGAGLQTDLNQIFKTETYEEIKKEILRGSFEDWMETEEGQEMRMDDEGILRTLTAMTRRRDGLLREFGW